MKAYVRLESKMEIHIKNFFSISMEFNPKIAYVNEDQDEDFNAACRQFCDNNPCGFEPTSQETDYVTDFQVTASEGAATVRAEVKKADLSLEWRQYIKMKGTSIYEILANAMFQCLKMAKKHLKTDSSDSSWEILCHPLTCGLFYYHTFRRICVSEWAEKHITQNGRVIYLTDKGEQVTISFDSPVYTHFCAYIQEADKLFGEFDIHPYPPHRQTMSLTMEDNILRLDELRNYISWEINEEDTEEDGLGNQCAELDILCIHGVKDCEHWIKSMHMIGKFLLSMRSKTQEERFRERTCLMTKEMEEALLHSEEDRRPAEERAVIAVYYCPSFYYSHGFTFNKRPYREWYIISGKRLEEGGWMLYGLSYDQKWEWGEVCLSKFQEFNDIYNNKTKKRPDVFGRKLKDVLEEYGQEGWESVLSEQVQQ